MSNVDDDDTNENFRRARALVDRDTPWTQLDEIVAFIKRPELRRVAEVVMKLTRSFSGVTVLRKLLEADEALGRAIAIHVAAEASKPMTSESEEDPAKVLLHINGKPYTVEDHAAYRNIIVELFATHGLTWENGVAKICAHDYQHGDAFDAVAERWMDWDRIDRLSKEPPVDGPGPHCDPDGRPLPPKRKSDD
jgi:hypothetical protein